MSATPKQSDFYFENGYLIIENCFSEEFCNGIIEIYDKAACGRYVNIVNLDRKVPAVYDLMMDLGILKLVDSLQSARMIPLATNYFFCKPANALEAGSNLHQDNLYPKSPYGSYIAVGVALDDADECNGALIVYPGTHKLGEVPSHSSENFQIDKSGKIASANPIGNAVVLPEDSVSTQLSYAKGSLVILHGHLIHGATKNSSESRWRRTLYINYIKDGDPFWPGWTAKRRLNDREKGFDENKELWE